jgi:hypothetical protein
MASLILDSVVDEQGQPVRHTSTQSVEQNVPVESSTFSPAESTQEVIQREAQAFHAGQALNIIRPQSLAAFQWHKGTSTKVPAALLTGVSA